MKRTISIGGEQSLSPQKGRRAFLARWLGRRIRSSVVAAVFGIAFSSSLYTAVPAYASSTSQPSVLVRNPGTSAESTYTLTLTTSPQGGLVSGSNIIIVAPNGTNFNTLANVSITDNTDPAGTSGSNYANTGNNNNTLIIEPSNAIGANNSLTIKMDNVTNPSTASNSDTLLVSTTADTTPIASAPYAIERLSVTQPIVAVADNSLGAATSYTLSFSTSPGGSLNSSNASITILAPNGTNFNTLANVSITDNTDPAGTSGSNYANTGNNNNTLIIEPSNAIGANNSLTIKMDNVTNPSTASSSDTLLVSTTADTTPIASAPYGIGTAPPPAPTPPHCSQTLPSGTVVGMATTGDGKGYWIASSTGAVASCGDAPNLGAMAATNTPIAAIAAAPNGNGYWLVTQAGHVHTFGSATYHGSVNIPLNKPIVAMAADPATGGYWLLGGDGGVFSFNAPFYGSTGNIRLNAPAVGMAANSDGGGYWFVASDGGVFSYGDAAFHGSMGGKPLNKPVVGMAIDPATGGYWLDASDGGIFSFNAPFYGSAGNIVLARPVVGMATMPNGGGYRFVASDGGIFDYGDAGFYGSTA